VSKFARVPLGDLLTSQREEVLLEPEETYRTAGVYSFGRGIFEREPVLGADTSYRSLFRLRENQFVISRLNGWEGAVDVVSPDVAGCLVSNEYPTFAVDPARADARYLRWITRWPRFWEQLIPRGSMVRRKRVQTAQLLAVEIPLPELDQQRRHAATLDRWWASTAEATQRLTRAAELTTALAVAMCSRPDLTDAQKVDAGWRKLSLRSIMDQANDPIAVMPDASYPNLGIYSYGRGLFAKPDIEGATTSAKILNRVRAGQFIYSRLFAFEGAYAFVPPKFDGYCVSNEFPTFDADPNQLDARWVATYLRSPDRWTELATSSKGLGVRRQRVPVESVLAYAVWLPPIEQQHAMVQTVDQLDVVANVRAEWRRRVESLVPAALNAAFGDFT
jgi:type I restriction enzyme S subunit